jgi:sec-independent protein translocase protein TatA
MPNIGPLELAIVAIIALVVFGPKRLPELGKSLGSGLREFKASISGENDDERAPQIENGIEEAVTEDDAPTSVATAEADTEAQTATDKPTV